MCFIDLWHVDFYIFLVEQPSVMPAYLEQPSRESVEEPEFEFDDETGLELEAHDGIIYRLAN